MDRNGATAARASRSCARSAAPSASAWSPTSIPTATRSARWWRCTASSPRWARTRSCSWPPTSSRCPTSTGSSTCRGSRRSRRPISPQRTIIYLDCGNIDRNPLGDRQGRRRPHPQHRPPPRQHALRHGRPRGPGVVVHDRDRLGPDARAGGRARPGARRGAVRRPGHRHRPVHVREHRPARARDGRRADRGRRRHARDLPPALRGHALRQARAARPGAGARASATTAAR